MKEVTNMTYDFSFSHFLDKYPRFKKNFGENLSVQDIYQFLSNPLYIDKMINANELGMTALSGVVKELESKFSNRTDIDLSNDVVKQLIGCMIQEIIHEFGYKSRIQRVVRNSKYFTSATHYEPDEASRKYMIVNKPTIEQVK